MSLQKAKLRYYSFTIQNNSGKPIRVGISGHKNKLYFKDFNESYTFFGLDPVQIDTPTLIIQFFETNGMLGNQYKMKICDLKPQIGIFDSKEVLVENWNIIVGHEGYGPESFSVGNRAPAKLCEVSNPITNNNTIWQNGSSTNVPFPTKPVKPPKF